MSMIPARMRNFLRKAVYQYLRAHRDNTVNGGAFDRLQQWGKLIDRVRQERPGDIAASGWKVYSQNDEDGIIAALFDRIGGGKTFIEVGVQTGQECNSHYLLLNDWRGCWIEANSEYCEEIRKTLGSSVFPGRFKVIEDFVTVANVAGHYRAVCSFLEVPEIDFYSLDIDGNDLFVLRSLLESGARPAAVCVEYNGRFPPPMAISVTLDEGRSWQSDDYYGASLQAFCDLFAQYGYRLVTCSVVGVNAFFVRGDHAEKFPQFSPLQVWHPTRLYLGPLPAPMRASMRYLQDKLRA